MDPEPDVVDPYNYPPAAQHAPEMSQYAQTGPGASQQAAYGAGYAAAGAGVGAAAYGAGAASTYDGSDNGGPGGVQRGPSTGSTLTSAGFAGRGTGNHPYYGSGSPETQMPTPVPTGTSSSTHDTNAPYGAAAAAATPSTAASRKMREAQQERLRNMYAQNDHADDHLGGGARSPGTAPGSPSAESAAGTMPRVHEDGGRFEPEAGEELPPQ